MKSGRDLTTGSLSGILFQLAVPSMGGMLGLIVCNLTDTFFVSRLGSEPLAAMGFTFPVIMTIGCVAMGIGMGASSIIARAFGASDYRRARQTTVDGVGLAVAATAMIGLAGLFTIKPLFEAMGASGQTLDHIESYMSVWYLGAVAAIVPPVSDGCMRAIGEMVRPVFVMLTIAVVNIVLDPLFIFGCCGFPAMGVKGAAIATIIARIAGMLLTLYFLRYHCRLLVFEKHSLRSVMESWKRIFAIGAPSAFVRALVPLSRGVFTALAMSAASTAGVAALAAGSRIESFVLIISSGFSIALLPVVGQNWGAGLYGRVNRTRKIANRFALILGAVTIVFLVLTARPLANIFSSDPDVIDMTRAYLIIISASHFGMCMVEWTSQALNAVGKPIPSSLLLFLQVFVLQVPLAFIGRKTAGFDGMLWGITAGQIIAAAIAIPTGKKLLHRRIIADCQTQTA